MKSLKLIMKKILFLQILLCCIDWLSVQKLKKGSREVTSSGIHGKLVELNDKDNTITIETGAGKIKFEKAAISVDLSKKFSPTLKKK